MSGSISSFYDPVDLETDTVHPDPCPHCGSALVLRKGRHSPFFGCKTWPSTRCPGTAGAHPDGSPMGTPADARTKWARGVAHAAFDGLTRTGVLGTRAEAYRWLARTMEGMSNPWRVDRSPDHVTFRRGRWDLWYPRYGVPRAVLNLSRPRGGGRQVVETQLGDLPAETDDDVREEIAKAMAAETIWHMAWMNFDECITVVEVCRQKLFDSDLGPPIQEADDRDELGECASYAYETSDKGW